MDKITAFLLAVLNLGSQMVSTEPDDPPREPFEYRHPTDLTVLGSTSTSDPSTPAAVQRLRINGRWFILRK